MATLSAWQEQVVRDKHEDMPKLSPGQLAAWASVEFDTEVGRDVVASIINSGATTGNQDTEEKENDKDSDAGEEKVAEEEADPEEGIETQDEDAAEEGIETKDEGAAEEEEEKVGTEKVSKTGEVVVLDGSEEEGKPLEEDNGEPDKEHDGSHEKERQSPHEPKDSDSSSNSGDGSDSEYEDPEEEAKRKDAARKKRYQQSRKTTAKAKKKAVKSSAEVPVRVDRTKDSTRKWSDPPARPAAQPAKKKSKATNDMARLLERVKALELAAEEVLRLQAQVTKLKDEVRKSNSKMDAGFESLLNDVSESVRKALLEWNEITIEPHIEAIDRLRNVIKVIHAKLKDIDSRLKKPNISPKDKTRESTSTSRKGKAPEKKGSDADDRWKTNKNPPAKAGNSTKKKT